MKKTVEMKNTELLLRDFRVLKAISNNVDLPEDQRVAALQKVNNIEIGLNVLNEDEMKLINSRYFNGLGYIEIARMVSLNSDYLGARFSEILYKMSRCMAV